MSKSFIMRMACTYGAEKNAVSDIHVEEFGDGEWHELELSLLTPGFSLFAYTVFTCQHTHLRLAAVERGLCFAGAQGTLQIMTDDAWKIEAVHVHFDVQLASGRDSAEDRAFIVSRMVKCPVSRNLLPVGEIDTRVAFTSQVGEAGVPAAPEVSS